MSQGNIRFGHETFMVTLSRNPAEALARSRPLAWVTIGLFALALALLGGSSRPDAIQIVALRPLAALFLLVPLLVMTSRDLERAQGPALLLAAFAGLVLLQLVPLPPALWKSLPMRDLVAQMDAAVGIEAVWRPLSLVPTRTLNALFGLLVPAAALLLALALRLSVMELLVLIAGLGVFDAALGLLQVVTGDASPLYFYAQTNRGLPVGIFANENHSAVFSALALLAIARLGISPLLRAQLFWLRIASPLAFLLVLLSVLVSGSRAGLGMGVLAVLASGLMLWLDMRPSRSRGGDAGLLIRILRNPRTPPFAFVLIVAIMFMAFVALDRAPGAEGLFLRDPLEDLRWRIWPVLTEMMGRFWILGSGFGSFEEVYHIFEPTGLLYAQYVNQAHNDWAQFVIEGGVPAIALLVALLLWILAALRSLAQASIPASRVLFSFSVFTIIAVASVFDYPLRAPAFQAISIWLVLVLALDSHKGRAAARD